MKHSVRVLILQVAVVLAAGCAATKTPGAVPAEIDEVLVLDQATLPETSGEYENAVLITWTERPGQKSVLDGAIVEAVASDGRRTKGKTEGHRALFLDLPLGTYQFVLDTEQARAERDLAPTELRVLPPARSATIAEAPLDMAFVTGGAIQVPAGKSTAAVALTFPAEWWAGDPTALEPETAIQLREVAAGAMRRFFGDVLVCRPDELPGIYEARLELESRGKTVPRWAAVSAVAVVDLREQPGDGLQLSLRVYDLETKVPSSGEGSLWGGIPLVYQDQVETDEGELKGVAGSSRQRNVTRELAAGMGTLLVGMLHDPIASRYLEALEQRGDLAQIIGLKPVESLERQIFGPVEPAVPAAQPVEASSGVGDPR